MGVSSPVGPAVEGSLPRRLEGEGKRLVSIIIVNYNTKDLLRTCLRSVYEQTHGLDFEIIVVDNASRDGSVEMLKEEFPLAKTLSNTANVGFARANNVGIRIARGDAILLLNPDTEILHGAIPETVRVLGDHPAAGIVGCRLLSPTRSVQQSAGSFPTLWNIFSEAMLLDSIIPKWSGRRSGSFDYSSETRVDYVSGAFFLIARGVLDSVGLLDEKFFMYSEEVDYCFRAKKAGYEVWFTPRGEVIHHWHGVSALSARSRHWVLRSQILFLLKHFHGPKKYSVVLLKFLGIGLRVVVYSLAGIVTLDKVQFKKAFYSAYAIGKLAVTVPRYHTTTITESAQAYHA
jgi:GT2 family glycosyltransferase